MKRTILSIITVFCTLLSAISVSAAASQKANYKVVTKNTAIFIDSKYVKTTLPILNTAGRNLYPFRELMEALGASVGWEQNTKTATATLGGITIKFPQGKSVYYVNGVKKTMDTQTIVDNDYKRTYVPIRYAFEAFSYRVLFIQADKRDEIHADKRTIYRPISDQDFKKNFYTPEYSSIAYYDYDPAIPEITFKSEYIKDAYKGLHASTAVEKGINKKVMDLIKVLADNKMYLGIDYSKAADKTDYSHVRVGYAFSNIVGTYYPINFSFFDIKPFDVRPEMAQSKASNKAKIGLSITQLMTPNTPFEQKSDKFVEDKMCSSMMVLFGDTAGLKIYDYIFSKYIYIINVSLDKQTLFYEHKIIDGVTIDIKAYGTSLSIFFTY